MLSIRVLTWAWAWAWALLGSLSVSLAAFTDAPARQIAIIGAGAGGSSAAFYMRRFADWANVTANITIFEKTYRIGGRTLTANIYDNPLERVEVGASIFIPLNEILYNSTKEFGLPVTDSFVDIDGVLGIWDGENFVYLQGKGSSWWEYTKLFWKYGMAPYRTQKLVDKTVSTFLKLYKSPYFPFRSLTTRVFELDLIQATSETGERFLLKNGISNPFAHDIVQASTRVNYASNLAYIHGLETMVSMAPEGALSVLGGNWQMFDNMVRASGAKTYLNTTVASISKQPEDPDVPSIPKYLLKTGSTDSTSTKDEVEYGPFDDVVLASPYQFSKITDAGGVLQHPVDEIPYVSLHVTLFTSPFVMSPAFFGLPDGSAAPQTILTTLAASDEPATGVAGAGKAGFFSISTLRTITNPKTMNEEYVYKIFSPQPITAEFLTALLGVKIPGTFTGGQVPAESDASLVVEPISWFHAHIFNSYPVAYPRVTFQDPILGAGLYYTSGIESFISTMETSALMGMNIARLIVDDIILDSSKQVLSTAETQNSFDGEGVEMPSPKTMEDNREL